MAKVNFWTRVGSLWRRPGGSSHSSGNGHDTGASVPWSPADAAFHNGAARLGLVAPRRFPARDSSENGQVAETLVRLVDLAAALEEHAKVRDEWARRLADAVHRFVDHLEGIRQASDHHTAAFAEIRTQLQAGATGIQRLENSLAELPRIADAQRETMVSVGRQLDVLREAGDRGTDTMKEVGQSLARLEQAAQSSTATIARLYEEAAVRAEVIRQHGRRMSIVGFSAAAAAALAVSVSLWAWLG